MDETRLYVILERSSGPDDLPRDFTRRMRVYESRMAKLVFSVYAWKAQGAAGSGAQEVAVCKDQPKAPGS